jgi:hypothetical protein
MESLDSGMMDNQGTGLDALAKKYLLTTAKWAKFLAIVGLVFVGLMVLLAFFAGAIFGKLGEINPMFGAMGGAGAAITIVYLIFAAMMFFPAWYLFQFAQKAISSIKLGEDSITEAFKNLKSCFKFYGVLTLVFLSFYGVILLFALVAIAIK